MKTRHRPKTIPKFLGQGTLAENTGTGHSVARKGIRVRGSRIGIHSLDKTDIFIGGSW